MAIIKQDIPTTVMVVEIRKGDIPTTRSVIKIKNNVIATTVVAITFAFFSIGGLRWIAQLRKENTHTFVSGP